MRRSCPPCSPAASSLYVGSVDHRRRDHVRDGFRYPLSFFGLDVDELPRLARALRLFAHNGYGVFALHDADYEGAAEHGLRAAVVARLRAHGIAGEPARIELLTQPRVLGYAFNPVSFFLCFDEGERLVAVLAEINNTYGGRHTYVLGPHNRTGDQRWRTDKGFYVSPYIHGASSYEWELETTRGRRHVRVTVTDAHGAPFFFASMDGEARELCDGALARQLVRYPLLPWRILGLIHWHAFLLRRRGVEHRPPPPENTRSG